MAELNAAVGRSFNKQQIDQGGHCLRSARAGLQREKAEGLMTSAAAVKPEHRLFAFSRLHGKG